MDTCSEKRTLGGLVRNWAFLAALIKADLGDCRYKKKESKFEICFKETLYRGEPVWLLLIEGYVGTNAAFKNSCVMLLLLVVSVGKS